METTAEGIGGIVLVPVLVIAVGILLWALVDVIRRPQERMRYLPKWAWLLVVLLGNTLGQIVYLVVGRDNSRPVSDRPGASADRAASAADALYGAREDEHR